VDFKALMHHNGRAPSTWTAQPGSMVVAVALSAELAADPDADLTPSPLATCLRGGFYFDPDWRTSNSHARR
jgi:hypothetical protein